MLAEMGLRVWSPAPQPMAALEAVAAPALPAAPSAPAADRVRPLPVAAVEALPVQLRPPAQQDQAAPGTALPAVAEMGWDELRRSAAECRACGLCGGRSNSVFGVGPSTARCLVVGEAPGEQEDAQGEPFAGQAAQLLANMLRAINLSSDAAPDSGIPPERQVFLSAALKCRPPPGSMPGPQELQQCRPYLARQIELLRPRIIVAMGRLAVQTLLGSQEPLGKLRGRVHAYQGIPVIVTFAPNYLLRNLADKARAWEDLCLVHATLQGLDPA